MSNLPRWAVDAMPMSLPIPMADAVYAHAYAMAATHAGQESSRPLSSDYELVGLVPEIAFGRLLGVEYDWTLRPAGDGRSDFQMGGWTMDVKAARKPFNMLRESGKLHADVLVLAGYLDAYPLTAWFLGWEFDTEMLKCPSKDFGYGIVNHYRPYRTLRPLYDLWEVIES